MNVDTELARWREDWQSDFPIPPDLRRIVDRQSRFMKFALISEVIVTVTIGGGTAGWAIRSGSGEVLLLAVETWIAIAVAWVVGIRINRGKWAPSTEDAAAFIDLSVRRCGGGVARVRFAALFFVAHTAFVLGWVYRNTPEPRMPLSKWLLSIQIDVVWLCSIAFFAFLVRYRRKKEMELARFLALGKELTCHE